jgi:hypothetical protein
MAVGSLGLLLALAVVPAPASAWQEMKKKDGKPRPPEKSQFFALFALPVDPQVAEDDALLKEAKVATDGPALLKFLASHVPTAQDRARLEPLTQDLASKNFKVRDQASKALAKEGPLALAVLRPLLGSGDLELVRRAEQVIAKIEERFTSAQAAAAVRLVRDRKPAGAVPLLLTYLPNAGNDQVEDEVVTTVLALTVEGKKIDPALAAALGDENVARRAVAALVLGREGSANQRAAVRQLLADKDAGVRFRAAQGLLCGRDTSGMPVLIALLADGPFRYAEQAEDLLLRVAGDSAPPAALANNQAARAKGHEAWKQWWQARADKFSLPGDTDLFFVNTRERCLTVTRHFLDSIVKGDFKAFQKSTDVPFNLIGQMSFATREELDNFVRPFLEMAKAEQNKMQMSFKLGKVLTVEEYTKKARPMEGDFLAKLPRAQTRVVWASLLQNGNPQAAGIIIRVTGGRARVIGLGQPGPDQP